MLILFFNNCLHLGDYIFNQSLYVNETFEAIEHFDEYYTVGASRIIVPNSMIVVFYGGNFFLQTISLLLFCNFLFMIFFLFFCLLTFFLFLYYLFSLNILSTIIITPLLLLNLLPFKQLLPLLLFQILLFPFLFLFFVIFLYYALCFFQNIWLYFFKSVIEKIEAFFDASFFSVGVAGNHYSRYSFMQLRCFF